MSISYKHTAAITRPGDASAATLDDFGQPTATVSATQVYSGKIDWQDFENRRQLTDVRRTDVGSESLRDAMDGYFPPNKFPNAVRPDDFVTSTINGNAKEGRILSVDYLEESIVVRWQK